MKNRLLLVLALAVLASSSGCMGTYLLQLQKKIPKVDGDKIKVSGHTIYGVSGELTETDVKWVNGVKTVGTMHGRVDSPIGSVTVDVEKGKIRQ